MAETVLPFERSRPMVRTEQADPALNGTLSWHEDDIAALDRELDADGPRPLSYTTGIERLDTLTCGLTQGNVLLVAGPTGGGKSSLALTCALTLGLANAPPVLYVSLEMPARDMAIRGAAWLTGISQRRLMDASYGRAQLSAEERQAVSLAAKWIPRRVRMMAGDLAVSDVRREAARLKTAEGLSVVVCDHIGLVRGEAGKRHDTRERAVADASRDLKKLAMELGVPVLNIAQFNRAADDKAEPELRHLRETGALAHDAAVVALLWPTADKARDRLRIFVRKNRFGECGEIETPWDGATGRLGEAAAGGPDAQ